MTNSDFTPTATCTLGEEDGFTQRNSLDAVRRALAAAEHLTNISSSSALSSTRLNSCKAKQNKGKELSENWENNFDGNMADCTFSNCEEDSFAFNLQVILGALVSVAEEERIDLEREVRCRIRSQEFEKLGNDDFVPNSLSPPEALTLDGRGSALNLGFFLHSETSSAPPSRDENLELLQGRANTTVPETGSTAVITTTEVKEVQTSPPTSANTVLAEEIPKIDGSMESVPVVTQRYIGENSGSVVEEERRDDFDSINETNLSDMCHHLSSFHVVNTEEEKMVLLDPPASIEGMTFPPAALDDVKDKRVSDTRNDCYLKEKNCGESVNTKGENARSMQDSLTLEQSYKTVSSIVLNSQKFTESALHPLQGQQRYSVGEQTVSSVGFQGDNVNSNDREVVHSSSGAASRGFSSLDESDPDEAVVTHAHSIARSTHSNALLDTGAEILAEEETCPTSAEVINNSYLESCVPVSTSSARNTEGSLPPLSESTVTPGASVDECKAFVYPEAIATARSSTLNGKGETAVSVSDLNLLRSSDPLGGFSTCLPSVGEEFNILNSLSILPSSGEAQKFSVPNEEIGQSHFTQEDKGMIDVDSSIFSHKYPHVSKHSTSEVTDRSDHSLNRLDSVGKDSPLTDKCEPVNETACTTLSLEAAAVRSSSLPSSTAPQNASDGPVHNTLSSESDTCSTARLETQSATLSPCEEHLSSTSPPTSVCTREECHEGADKCESRDGDEVIGAPHSDEAHLLNTISEHFSDEKFEDSDMKLPYSSGIEVQLLPCNGGSDDAALVSGECSLTTLTLAQIQHLPLPHVCASVSLSATSTKMQSSNAAHVLSEMCAGPPPPPVAGEKAPADGGHWASSPADRTVCEKEKSELRESGTCSASSLPELTSEGSHKRDSESCDSRLVRSRSICKPFYGLLLFEQVIRDCEKEKV